VFKSLQIINNSNTNKILLKLQIIPELQVIGMYTNNPLFRFFLFYMRLISYKRCWIARDKPGKINPWLHHGKKWDRRRCRQTDKKWEDPAKALMVGCLFGSVNSVLVSVCT